ncbi:DgyrCDS13038 [Dimorphilus gyrociliatus]|uniref:DgyrCDS13038 n=1 Tax=Dimorphilus gyrociliatus TaxID=2664684 RepID=A0A7I8W9F7_9ANNE|nr:DgyrCDS13038 [Dimorphilus gyrociliatus]
MTSKFNGKVISVESVRYPNWWLDADPKVTHNSAIETKIDIQDVDTHISAHWRVIDAMNGFVYLENVKFPKHYLDAHEREISYYTKKTRVTMTETPSEESWTKWKIIPKGGNIHYIQSEKYKDYLDAHESGWIKHRLGPPSLRSEFRIRQVTFS